VIFLEEHDSDKFYNKDWFIWLTLIFIPPLGIFLMWKNKKFNTSGRVVASVFSALLFLVPFGLNGQGIMTTQNNRYGQTNFSRVGWTSQPYFNFGQWFTNRNTGTQTAPMPTDQGTQPIVKPTESPATQPIGSNWKALQDKIFELTNVERKKNNLANFVYNATVEKYAVSKSQDMAKNNYFDHKSPTNGYFSDIWKKDGFKYTAGAENLYYQTDSRGFASRDINSLAQTIVTGWMNSEGHRRNILNGNLKELGVGVAENNNRLYATQLFHTN